MNEDEQARLEEIMEDERRRRERGAPSRFAYEDSSAVPNSAGDYERWKALEEIYRNRRDAALERNDSSDAGGLATILGLMGSAAPVDYAERTRPDLDSIRRIGAMMALGGTMSPDALVGLSALNGFNRGVESALARNSEGDDGLRYRLTHEMRTIPKPDADTDALIHEVLSRYMRSER